MKTTYDVAVHKGIALVKGESLRTFTSKLREQGDSFMLRKLNLTEKSASAYLVEVFSGACVFQVHKFEGRESAKFYAVKFERKEGSDTFEFGSTTEVERIATFRPKEAGVTKGVGETPGWTAVTKAFWGGVL